MGRHLSSFEAMAIKRSGLWLFKPTDAIKVIDGLSSAGIRVLGLDAFIVTDAITQPIMEHSIDFSQTTDAWSLARDFLTLNQQNNMLFEVIADE